MSKFKSFSLCETTYNQIAVLPEGLQVRFFKAVSEYGLFGNEPYFSGLELSVWIPMRDFIDSSKERREINSRNGQSGGAPAGNTNATKPDSTKNNQNQPKTSDDDKNQPDSTENKPNGNGNDNVNEKGNDNIPALPEQPPNGSPSLPYPADSTPKTPPDAERLARLLRDLHQKEDPKYNPSPPHMRGWAADIDKLHRLNGRGWEEIERVIRWAKTPGNFWFPNIMSGEKLREKFPALIAQMTQQGRAPPPKTAARFENDRTPIETIF